MSDREKQAIEFVEQQLHVLDELHKAAMNSLNAVLAKERLQKWKHYVVTALADKVGPEPARQFARDWLETPYAPDDIFDEFNDDVDMCRRHLRQLLAALQNGPEPRSAERPSSGDGQQA